MRTSNELSTLYKSIDQKNISESAKETLKKIRLANKNFKGKDEDAQELFIEFFNKLKSSKPVAVKTTQEYKDALKKAQIERGRKMREGKGKPKEPKGEGNEVDANRPAKPFGWRMRGKHNYRKPTRDDISKGKAYYEGRVNRADVKRKKYPMLAKGGMAEGGETSKKRYVKSSYNSNSLIDDKNKASKYFLNDAEYMLKSYGNAKVEKVDNSLPDGVGMNYIVVIESYKKYEEGGEINGNYLNSISADKKERILKNIAKHYGISLSEAEEEVKDSDAEMLYEYIANDNGLRMEVYNDIENKKYEDGGYMAKGGAIKNQYEGRTPDDIWNNLSKSQRGHFVYDHEQEIANYKGIGELSSLEIRDAYNSDWADLDEDIKNRFDNHTRVGQYAKGGTIKVGDKVRSTTFKGVEGKVISKKGDMLFIEKYNALPNGDTQRDVLRISEVEKMAQGGEVGKSFTISEMNEKLDRMFPDSFGFSVGTFSNEGNKNRNSSALIANENDPFRGLKDSDIESKLFFPQYKRVHDIRFRIYQGGENTYFHFNLESEKGDEYIGQFGFKDQGNVPSSYITRFIAFLMEQYGLPFEVNHSVMAKGGAIGGMSTYVSARDIEEIKLTINGDMKTLKGSDLMDGVYVKKASLKAKFDAYEVYNKLSDMAYNVWDKLKIESGSQIYNSDAIQKKLQVDYEKMGVDSLFKSLTKAQRKKVAEILTDENQHSLRNYLALRGYLGDEEYDDYKRLYIEYSKSFLSPYVITRVVTMAEGGILKEDDSVWNALGKRLLVDKVTKDEYYLVGYGQPFASPFVKSKIDNYIKKGEWTLKSREYAEGGEVFYTEKHKND